MGIRNKSPYTIGQLTYRVLWGASSLLFRAIPRQMWFARAQLLRFFGAKIGKNVRIYPNVKIFMPCLLSVGSDTTIGNSAEIYNLGIVRIGSRVTISQRCYLCAGSHKWRDPNMELIKSTITISDDVWLAADVFIGPKVTIGVGTIVGARCTVMTSIPDNKILKSTAPNIEENNRDRDYYNNTN